MDNQPTANEQFQALLRILKEQKPNDRSDRDRYWAITITDVERAYAVFALYARDPQSKGNT